jgi:hypothetical protein
MADIVNGCGVKVIREGLYIPGLKAGVFRPSPLPSEIKRLQEHSGSRANPCKKPIKMP